VYKLLLCWRYLLTRYLALACIISVMLGVATLIVVNSVMSGFSTKLKQRLHGLLSDVLLESLRMEGFANPDEKMRRIWESSIGDKIEAMTPTIEILGLIQVKYQNTDMPPKPVHLIGIDPKGRARIGGFAEYLMDPRNKVDPSFELSPQAKRRHEENQELLPVFVPPFPTDDYSEIPRPRRAEAPIQPPAGIFLGYSIANFRKRQTAPDSPPQDVPIVVPGDEVILHTISGAKFTPVYDNVVVADLIKTEMSEYDSQYVFVPLDWLQRLRSMENHATCLQIRLKDFSNAKEVVERLREMFPAEMGYYVETWEDKQGALLAAIAIEKGILNVLLFLIVGVAGFGILAIFAMIVVEKTRDIGILKALGASNGGVMNIFLGYGLLLGVIGAVFGSALGLTITVYINEIEHFLTRLTGQEIFPREVYYFDQIPTDIQALSVGLINAGAVAIAVVFSVIPALRAAMLHPVQALRYE
jgi:lipoprotein-releasing system permease protein